MKSKDISILSVRRLARYYRYLQDLSENKIVRISSKDLANKMGLNASQIRQDLSFFGDFGQKGYGYSVEKLKDNIEDILGLKKKHKTTLIGAGNMGKTITSHLKFEQMGFKLVSVFDKDPNIIGTEITGLKVQSIDDLEKSFKTFLPEVIILCVPTSSARTIVKTTYNFGIKKYWNFSHYDIALEYEDVIVENVHLADSLMTFCYQITESNAE